MLGEKIGEISGKVTMQRVLPNLGGDPKMETSFQATGSVLGTNIKDTGTYTTIFRPDGTQYGEGQGIMITKDGKTATWTGHGVGTKRRNRDLSRASYFQPCPRNGHKSLNGLRCSAYSEHAVDADGQHAPTTGMEVGPGSQLL
jgi:hypothetical protein